MNRPPPEPQSAVGRLGWRIPAFLLLFLLLARYLPSPQAALVADDWYNLARSSFYASHAEAAATGLTDPNRPLSMMAVEVVFRVFGMDPLPWTLLSMAGNALLVLFTALLVHELTGRRDAALVAGVVLAALPNLVETYHWSTQVLNEVACALVWYAGSAWAWVRYRRRGGTGSAVFSVAAYAVALFSYEAGILLPAALLALVRWRERPVRDVLALAPFGVVMVCYAAWRATNAFGMNTSWFYPAHMQVGSTFGSMLHNAWQVALWWAGDHLLAAVHQGWSGLWSLPPWTLRGLLLLNAAVVVAPAVLWPRLVRGPVTSAPPFRSGAVALFGVAWLGAAVAPQLFAYTAPRLQVLPAIGVALLVALALVRLPAGRWVPWLVLPLWISIGSNQGTTVQYREAGAMNRGLYHHLVEQRGSWIDKEIVVFDTAALRQRQTHGLLGPVSRGERAWAYHGNALLFRGFVPRGMIELAAGDRHCPVVVVHDMENGARRDGGEWIWHDRFNPSREHRTPVERAYHVDVWRVASGQP